jgi:hypothetical protein
MVMSGTCSQWDSKAQSVGLRGRRFDGVGSAGWRGGFESFVERAIVGDELTDPLFKRGVLGGDSLDVIACPFGFQVANLAEQFANAVALKQNLRAGGLECVLGIEGPLTPG